MSSSSWIFRKQSFSFSNVTGESKCLIVTYISLSQNCVTKLYNVWASRELKLRYDEIMKEAKAGSLWDNLVLRTFFTHTTSTRHKRESVFILHTGRASANESTMASQTAGCCLAGMLASSAGIAFMWCFTWILFDLYNSCPPDERGFFPVRNMASLYQGERYTRNNVSHSVLMLASRACILSLT